MTQYPATIPDWAQELTLKVCKDRKRWPPKVLWKPQTCDSSSGVQYTYKRGGYDILLRAGISEQDQKLVLLHELAHYILCRSKRGKREHHSLRFWRLAFELYDQYGVESEYAFKREKNYKVKARWAYNERLQANTN